MKNSLSTGTEQLASQRPRGIRIIAIADAILLGLFPIFSAILGFLVNLSPTSFFGTARFGKILILTGWYAPLEWYIMNGRLINSAFDFFVGHGLVSLAPGLVLLVASIWVWRGRAMSRNILVALVVIVNLLSAITVLTIRSFGPFPSWLIISRWLFSGILIALNVLYFLRPTVVSFYKRQ